LFCLHIKQTSLEEIEEDNLIEMSGVRTDYVGGMVRSSTKKYLNMIKTTSESFISGKARPFTLLGFFFIFLIFSFKIKFCSCFIVIYTQILDFFASLKKLLSFRSHNFFKFNYLLVTLRIQFYQEFGSFYFSVSSTNS